MTAYFCRRSICFAVIIFTYDSIFLLSVFFPNSEGWGKFFFHSENQNKGKESMRLLDEESHLEQTIQPTLPPCLSEHFKLNSNLYQPCNGLLFSCIF